MFRIRNRDDLGVVFCLYYSILLRQVVDYILVTDDYCEYSAYDKTLSS